MLPVCQAAEQIVVYCNGGDCDDSETAAILLRDVGIANRKLFIYGGGITEWTTNRLPVEIGARNSGNLSIATNDQRSPHPEGPPSSTFSPCWPDGCWARFFFSWG